MQWLLWLNGPICATVFSISCTEFVFFFFKTRSTTSDGDKCSLLGIFLLLYWFLITSTVVDYYSDNAAAFPYTISTTYQSEAWALKTLVSAHLPWSGP